MGEGVEMCTDVCWQSGQVVGVGSRKGQVRPVRQQELCRGRGGDDCIMYIRLLAVRPVQQQK